MRGAGAAGQLLRRGGGGGPGAEMQGWLAATPARAGYTLRVNPPKHAAPPPLPPPRAADDAAAAQTPQPPLSRRVWQNLPALRALCCLRRKGSSPVYGPGGQSIPSNLGGVPPRGGFELCPLETTDLGLVLKESPQLWSATKSNMMTRQQAEVNNHWNISEPIFGIASDLSVSREIDDIVSCVENLR